jgi:hypothetical protein
MTERFLHTGSTPGGCTYPEIALSACSYSYAPIAQMDRASDYESGGAGNQLASASTISDLRRGEGYGLAVTWRRAKAGPLLRVGRISCATPSTPPRGVATYPQPSYPLIHSLYGDPETVEH